MEAPSWLNESLLATALRGHENNAEVTVERFSVQHATAAGDNYTSYLYRVGVDYKVGQSGVVQRVSLIVKVPMVKGMFKDLSEKFDFFGAEPLIYNKLLPKIYKKMNSTFAPKSFPCPIKNGLVLEDLKPEGYVLCDKFTWLDFPHCKVVVETLAKFHAGSVAYHRDDPDLVEAVGREKFFVGERMKPWAEASYRTCAKILMDIGGHGKLVEFLLNKANSIWESVLNLLNSKSASLNVLNHGDIWINNLLFKYSSTGEPIDIKLIDFQLARYGSPALDLIFFIWTSASEEVRENLQELYNVYLETLNKSLEEFGCKERLSSEMLQRDLQNHADWVLVMVCFINSFIMRESEEFIDVSSLTEEQLRDIASDPRFPRVFDNRHYKPLLPGIARQLETWLSL